MSIFPANLAGKILAGNSPLDLAECALESLGSQLSNAHFDMVISHVFKKFGPKVGPKLISCIPVEKYKGDSKVL